MKQFFIRFFPYIKEYKACFIYAIIGALLVALASAAAAYLVKPVLDDIFIKKDETMLKILPFLVVLAYFAKGLGTYIQTYYMSFVGNDIVRRLKDNLLSKILSFEIGFFNSNRNGEIISRVMNDINAIQGAVSNHFMESFRESATIVALICVVIYQSPELAFYGLVVMPLVLYPIILIAKKMRKFSKKIQEKNADLSSKLVEIFNNVELVKISSSDKMEISQFASRNRELFNAIMKSVKLSELYSPIMETIGAIAVAVVIVVGGYKVIDGELSTGAFFSFVTALFMLYTPIKRVSGLYLKFQVAFVAGDRIYELLNRESGFKSGSEILEKVTSVEFSNVGLKYDDKEALRDINLKLNYGDTIALVGSSGGGKSSLVNLLLRLYEPTSGEVLINGKKIESYDYKSLTSKIGVVTQRIFIFNDSVANNIAYGDVVDENRVIESLKSAMIYDYIESLPNGIYTNLDEFGANLSGGQRQRIAIARALYKNPEILILDEATSALDNKTEEGFKESLRQIIKYKIVIIVAHRPSTLSLADTLYFLKDGKIIDSGNLDNLLKTCETFREYYKSV
ncbi:ABC transporter ATP-binding protein [Helicobacter sp. WB40]|uniref:ABC transporter ATP-binding protein n=1 Tax=Helicobacter sp. WB40 TaxID=3004130 RepID=UPI0022EBFAC6|nr:ABC transporter ATP-binding protein [Helicobacter sp. WB40]MDA3966721.1 ABC transporter ATP-binding protein [Helicobacter sp. WB40]